VCFFLIFLSLFVSWLPVKAENLPDEVKKILANKIEGLRFRLDGLPEKEKTFWLALKPNTIQNTNGIELTFESTEKEFLFSNDWLFIPVENNTIKSFNYYPPEIQNKILETQIIDNFVVPKDFSLPRDLAMLAGERPLNIRNIELESDKEELFQKIYETEKETGALRFLAYSIRDLELLIQKINPEKEELDSLELKKANEEVSFINKIKKIDGEIYLSDYNAGKILKLKTEKDFVLEAFAELPKAYEGKKLKDFAWNKERTILYLLTGVDSELLIINLLDNKVITTMKLNSNPDFLTRLNQNGKLPDLLVYGKKGENKIEIISDLNFRISDTIDLNTIVGKSQILNLFVDKNLLWIALEKHLLIYDLSKKNITKVLDFDFDVYKVIFDENEQKILVVGHNSMKSFVAKINQEDFFIEKTIDLDLDIQKTKEAKLCGSFLLIPSPSSKLLGLIEKNRLEIIKKFQSERSLDLIEIL
jgi:hypothetical protein